MRTKQGYGNRREEEEYTVSLNRLRVKSSSEHCVKRRALRGLRAAAGSEGRRQQMAGESGERKRLPKRPLHGGGAEEKLTGNLSESVKTQTGLMAPKERRGKENSAGKPNPAAGKMKMEDTAVSGAAEQTDLSVFFDEDSNHIFPVEQFFGNLDSVQDFSRRATATEGMSRREYRRRHYYAKEDSDEEQT
ncbi:UPF0688 protein C1orf174 homolog isoform X2 [Colossoma macropomum]|uniref:UPF0688 protein C1orf174 homolog isoform X2 n=1 Tax=Colossoma macropomum TaxID=42526 RepID=UPI001864C144|nr:UPF0688 protein C1orf174 homolog isoform X2 [Colossoma macropomum]